MVTCEHCWAGELVLINGMMTCEACGEVQQDFLEEHEEFMPGIHDQSFFRKWVPRKGCKGGGGSTGHTLGGRRGRGAHAPREPLRTREALRAYAEAAQTLLQAQVAALCGRCGVDGRLRDVARQLWFALLADSGILEDAFADEFEEKFEGRALQAGDEDAPGEGGDAGSGKQRDVLAKYTTQMLRVLSPVLHYRLTLGLLQIACCLLREAVAPPDLSRWAAGGTLPYLHFGLQSWALLGPHRRLFGPTFFTPKSVPGPRRVLHDAQDLAARLGVEVPPLNAAAWLERYAAELALPQVAAAAAMVPVSLELCRLYRFGPALAITVQPHPWAMLMAVLLVSLKLCYGLDGRGREAPPGLPPPPDWLAWAAAQLPSVGLSSAFPTDADGVLALSGSEFTALVAYLMTVVAPPHRLSARGWRSTKQHLDLPAHRALAAAALAEPAADAHAAAAKDSAGPGPTRQPLPPLRADAYPFFGVKPPNRALSAVDLPPEYAAALAVASAAAFVTPQALHKLVTELEEHVMAAECEVSYAHNQLEAARRRHLEEWLQWLTAGAPRQKKR
eukprot:scaffold30.g4430.t1